MARTVPTNLVEIAWSDELTGAFTIGTSTIDGPDVITGGFGNNVFNDVTADVKRASGKRGRSHDLAAVEQGTCTLTLKDPTGKYNPERAGYADEVLADSPVGYWRLGESSGTAAADSSGNGLDGTYTGGVVLAEAGAPSSETDTAARFDGSTGYVALPANALLNITGPITLECWLKSTSAAEHLHFLGGYDPNSPFAGYGLRLSAGKFGYWSGAHGSWVEASPSVNDGAWHHLAVSVSGTTASFYVDGAAAGTPSTQQPNSYSGVRAIGSRATGNGLFFPGTLDEVAVYSGALSAARILAHYEAGTLYLARKLLPMRPVRVRSTHLGTTYGRFYGFVASIEHDPHPNVQETVIECVDFFEWLATQYPVIAATGATTVGTAIGLILDAVEWTDAAMRSLDTGSSIPDFEADGTRTAIEVLRDLLAVDLGAVAVDGDGVVHYRDRTSRYGAGSVADTFTGSLLGAARPSTSKDRIRNRATVTRTGGTAQTSTDETSRKRYGYRDHPPITSDYLNSDTEAASLAAFLVLLQKDPRPPTRGALLGDQDDTVITKQLARELNDRVALSETGGGTDTEGIIERIEWDIGDAGHHLRTRYLVAKRLFDVFTIGSSTIGGAHVIGYACLPLLMPFLAAVVLGLVRAGAASWV